MKKKKTFLREKSKEFREQIKRNYIPDVLTGKRSAKSADTESASVAIVSYTDMLNLQRNAARAPRMNALSELIIGYVGTNPTISAAEVLSRLQSEIDRQEVIYSIEDGTIEWEKDGITKFTPSTAIKDRLYRIKKKYSSR